MSDTDSLVRILVTSEVRLYRDGLVESIARSGQARVVGVACDRAEAVDAVRRLTPDIVLLDTAVPDSIGTVHAIVAARAGTRVVACAVAGDESDVVAFAEAGISGYVPRDGSVADLLDAVRSAARGEVVCSPRVAGQAFRRLAALSPDGAAVPDGPDLTPREAEVAALLELGLSNKQIARRLAIKLATVKNHVHNILEKLQVRRRGEAAALVRAARRRAVR